MATTATAAVIPNSRRRHPGPGSSPAATSTGRSRSRRRRSADVHRHRPACSATAGSAGWARVADGQPDLGRERRSGHRERHVHRDVDGEARRPLRSGRGDGATGTFPVDATATLRRAMFGDRLVVMIDETAFAELPVRLGDIEAWLGEALDGAGSPRRGKVRPPGRRRHVRRRSARRQLDEDGRPPARSTRTRSFDHVVPWTTISSHRSRTSTSPRADVVLLAGQRSSRDGETHRQL